MRYYLRLIRWQNLGMLVLGMLLTRYKIILPNLSQAGVENSSTALPFALLVLAVVLIAAAGFVVNDIQDFQIAKRNNPEKLIIGTHISEQATWWLYRSHTLGGLLAGIAVGWLSSSMQLPLLLFLGAGILWFYSYRYKCIPLIGNLAVSLAAAFTISIVWLLDFFMLRANPFSFSEAISVMPTITGLILPYTLFVLAVHLIVEIVKDIKNVEADKAENCKTLAVAIGERQTRIIAVSLTVILFSMIGFWQLILFYSNMKVVCFALIPAAVLTAALILRLAFVSDKKHFYQASQLLKLILLFGILSMIFLP